MLFRSFPSAPTLTAVTVAPSTPSWDEVFEEAVLSEFELDELLSVTVPETVVDSPPFAPPPPESQPTTGSPTMRSNARLHRKKCGIDLLSVGWLFMWYFISRLNWSYEKGCSERDAPRVHLARVLRQSADVILYSRSRVRAVPLRFLYDSLYDTVMIRWVPGRLALFSQSTTNVP